MNNFDIAAVNGVFNGKITGGNSTGPLAQRLSALRFERNGARIVLVEPHIEIVALAFQEMQCPKNFRMKIIHRNNF